MTRSLYLVSLLLISLNINALDNFDECTILKTKLLDDHNKYSFDDPISNQYNYNSEFIKEYSTFRTMSGGLVFDREFETKFNTNEVSNRVFTRTADGNIILQAYYPYLKFKQKDKPPINSEISMINGFNLNELNDFEITTIIDKSFFSDGNISITVKANDKSQKIYEFNVLNPWLNGIAVENFIYEISNIDSASSSFDMRMREDIYWRQFGLNEIGIEISKEYGVEKFKESLKNDQISPSFMCSFTPNEWEEMKMFIPDISIQNAIENKVLNEEIIFEWSYDFYFDESKGFQVIIEDSSFYNIQLSKDSIYKLKSDFEYSAFPFDSQVFSIEYGLNKYTNDIPMIFNPFERSLSESLPETNIYEWNIVNFDTSKTNKLISGVPTLGHNINIKAERNYFYYLIKVYLPILIVLTISLSVLFINPTQLESRLTVGVVCFLALIAYTYIIDQEVPKLTYLTIMDYVILISYFFASIPVIQSIVAYSLSENNLENSIRFNQSSKIVIPIFYILSIILTSYLIINSSANVISAFK